MPNLVDLTGQRFSRLLVLERGVSPHRGVWWLCRCDCGTVKTVRAPNLKSGGTKSCGCYSAEVVRTLGRNSTHGMSKTRTYQIWFGVKKRCQNPKSHAYLRYGGRGIRLCAEWQTFEGFFASMGAAPEGLEIDRIDPDGHYEPGNCRWATLEEQANNKRNNWLVDGLTLTEIARRDGIPYPTIYYRHVLHGRATRRSDQ